MRTSGDFLLKAKAQLKLHFHRRCHTFQSPKSGSNSASESTLGPPSSAVSSNKRDLIFVINIPHPRDPLFLHSGTIRGTGGSTNNFILGQHLSTIPVQEPNTVSPFSHQSPHPAPPQFPPS